MAMPPLSLASFVVSFLAAGPHPQEAHRPGKVRVQWDEAVEGHHVHVFSGLLSLTVIQVITCSGRRISSECQQVLEGRPLITASTASLRVVLTGNGPTMVHTSTLGAVHKVRRVGNVLFTRCFAEVFLRLSASERQSSEEVHGPFADPHPALRE